jgi:hypothetical protein
MPTFDGQTKSPTSFPTSAPTIDCQFDGVNNAFGNTDGGVKVTTSFQFDLDYNQTALELNGVKFNDIMSDLDEQITNSLLPTLFSECAQDTTRRRQLREELISSSSYANSNNNNNNNNNDLLRKLVSSAFQEVVGMNSTPVKVLTDKTCADSQSSLGTCVVVGGETSVFIQGKVEPERKEDIEDAVVTLIADAEISGAVYSMKSVGVSAGGAGTGTGTTIDTDDEEEEEYYYVATDAPTPDEYDDYVYMESETLTGLQVSMIAVGSCVAVGFGLLVHRRYKDPKSRRSSDDSDDLADYSVDRDDDGNGEDAEDYDKMQGKIIAVIDESKAMLGKCFDRLYNFVSTRLKILKQEGAHKMICNLSHHEHMKQVMKRLVDHFP